ncbi:hypothetical protein HETIRDRAFT_455718 [Heterobasidion irregulare TC 32-1]|uniref:F-box domain-containing protein n=1 Tax=Heterobasidion irregulare (strain TC 32-1) TaxID=747525 RepID=W4JTF0_HETIT|nr:uncharacterized protein HETIRDRAFT_455718 [Heterobasidion irregulare TC 32-1]ETW76176.1 hypothetical protein HETIRDRAFT_455718 [Heterobasidion irregulare TC 32-1]
MGQYGDIASLDRRQKEELGKLGLGIKVSQTPIRYFTLLPTELVDIIYTYLPGHISVIFFALTSRRHWQIGRPHIRSRVLALTTWAGDRIICVGDSCWGNDVPPGLELTSAEETELREGRTRRDVTEGFWSDDDDDDFEDTECSTLFDLVDRFRSSVDVLKVVG